MKNIFLATLTRPVRFCFFLWRRLTGRGSRHYIYMKSGNVIKLDVEELTITRNSEGEYSKMSWESAGYIPNHQLLSIELDQVEAITYRKW
jgi:hypothetical protein